LYGWQYGPFAFEEERDRHSWPLAVEKAAYVEASQKLGVKEPKLDIQRTSTWLSWHVVASGPSGERLEMNFADDGKPLVWSEMLGIYFAAPGQLPP
jgi:hypothetical protein